ncbi:outer membrane beta-barrel protein [Pontixanthobacter sp.]|uniref:outer membrane beta-barrel protein n=1 Tax=Pontixanthobacter sp. TaxID=2792078 RepID=UPI003C7DDD1E
MKNSVLLASAFAICITAPSTAFAQQDAAKAQVIIGGSAGYHDISDDGAAAGLDSGGFIFGGVAGVDVPVGEKLFIGAEANYHFGEGLIDSEYGIAARAGYRLEGGAKLFVRAGYQEVDFDLGAFENAGFDDTAGDYLLGAGADLPLGDGPLQLRFNVDTIAFDSVRGTAGLVLAF